MLSDFLVPFVATAVAEVGDKTQLSILLLASKTRQHGRLLAGVMLAFLLVDGIAIAAGSWVTGLISHETLKTVSGIVFIAFGVFILAGGGGIEDDAEKASVKSPFLAAFTLTVLAEWGDKTQIAAGLLSTEYDSLLVLAGTLAALFVLSAIAVYAGKAFAKKINRRALSRIAGLVFVLIGLLSLAL